MLYLLTAIKLFLETQDFTVKGFRVEPTLESIGFIFPYGSINFGHI
jgi:hypothetical protein